MIYLLLDLFISSITRFNTSFIIFDIYKKHSFIYILIISLLISFFTQNILYFIIIVIVYYLIVYLKRYISNKYIIYFISYLLIYNFNLTINSFIIFIISVLFIYFNPYN